MSKYVVISSNDNDDYFHYIPIVTEAWNRLGWSVICLYSGNKDTIPYFNEPNILIHINKISEFRDATIVQVSRLFAGCLNLDDEDFVMTSDVDMLPCSNYWQPDQNEITVYGYDLTDFSEFPICYIAMKVKLWRDVMQVEKGQNIMQSINNFLNHLPNAKSEVFEEWWGVDQQEITRKLSLKDVKHIYRSKRGIYALGRVDRGDWDGTLNQDVFIDSHLPRPAKNEKSFNQVYQLLNTLNLLPNWYNTYCYE
jgi:hypothetical protein